MGGKFSNNGYVGDKQCISHLKQNELSVMKNSSTILRFFEF